MPWIESHSVVERHRKTLSLARSLGIKPVVASGHLHALWHSAIEQQEDGDLTVWSDDMIAGSALWEGDARAFVKALQDSGFMDDRILHDWLVYAGRYLSSRYRTSKPGKWAEIQAKHNRQSTVSLKSVCSHRDPVGGSGGSGPVGSGENQEISGHSNGNGEHESGRDPGQIRDNPQLLALEAHRAFPNPPQFPAATVVGNVTELLQSGQTPDSLRTVFAWASKPGDYKPKSPATLTDPAKFQGWLAKSTEPPRRRPGSSI